MDETVDYSVAPSPERPAAAGETERFVAEVVRGIFGQEISDEKVREVARKVEKALGLQSSAQISRGGAAIKAILDIEAACNYSPYREVNQWDQALAGLIHSHARKFGL